MEKKKEDKREKNKEDNKEEKKINEIKLDLELINFALAKSLLRIELLYEYLELNRNDDFAFDLMFDAIKELSDSVSDSLNFEKSFY